VTRRVRRGLALLLAAVVVLSGCAESEPVGREPVRRVLVVSMPGLTWSEVQDEELPALEGFVRGAAIGDISTRIGRRRASSTDAYLTIGAGTRSLAPEVDVAVALDPDETYGGVRTSEILARRLGEVPSGVAYLAAGAAADRNEGSLFGATPGLLGDLLEAAGVNRAVVANADAAEGFVSDEPPPDGAYARGAATALMGSDGIVPGGTVGRDLLAEDPLAPFGRRLDTAAVLRAFTSAWERPGRSVVLVEASDMARAAAYSARATAGQARALRSEALEGADGLLEELLALTSPEDAVLVVSPVAGRTSPELAVTALRAPGVEAGLLRSSTTRRDGYVQLADVAPTILDLVGEDQPDQIEGRPFEVSPPGDYDRIERLADGADAAGFRDSLMPVVVPSVIGLLVLMALAALLPDRLGRRRALVVPAALFALGVVPATFVVGQLPWTTGSTVLYAVAVVAVAVAIGSATTFVERRRRGLGVITALGIIVLLVIADVSAGAPLQVNAVFGYSLAVAGRFAGLGNLAFALFGSATVLLGALLAERYGRAGVLAAGGLWTTVVLVEGLPMLGADVGGVVSMVPAFGAATLVLVGKQLRVRHAVILLALSVVAVLGFAFVDMGRGAGSQTHLARLAEHALERRWGAFGDNLARRLEASFGGMEAGLWALVLGAIAGTAAYVVLAARGHLGPGAPRRLRQLPVRAAAVGVGVLALVGLVANDSSIAVPTTMLIVVSPVVAIRHVQASEAST